MLNEIIGQPENKHLQTVRYLRDWRMSLLLLLPRALESTNQTSSRASGSLVFKTISVI